MAKDDNAPICCAHYISKYLPLTENWIYRILINHRRYQPIVLSRKNENLELFSVSGRYSLDDLSLTRQYFEILYFKFFGYFRFFKNICAKNSVRILHVHFGYHGVKMTGLKRKLKIPMVCSFYGDDAFARQHVGKYNELFRMADRILVLGAYMKAELVKLGCPENKILIHHLGIDPDKITFVKRKIQKGDKVRFLIGSSFVAKKGIDLAIKALVDLKKYDFSLDIVGDGPLRHEILKEIEIGGIADRTRLHGYQPYEYLIELATQCHVFIQASRTTANNNKEGTPMAIVDAMATGMAVVSTRHSDIPEIVIDGQHGYLAEENNLTSLVGCIRKIFEDPGKIESFSINSREWIGKEFNAKEQTCKLEGYYRELISGKKRD